MNRKGFTIIEGLLSIAIISSVVLVAMDMLKEMVLSNQNANSILELAILRNQIVTSVLDNRNWEAHIRGAKNANFSCILNRADCVILKT